jgi:hypothetical protein
LYRGIACGWDGLPPSPLLYKPVQLALGLQQMLVWQATLQALLISAARQSLLAAGDLVTNQQVSRDLQHKTHASPNISEPR